MGQGVGSGLTNNPRHHLRPDLSHKVHGLATEFLRHLTLKPSLWRHCMRRRQDCQPSRPVEVINGTARPSCLMQLAAHMAMLIEAIEEEAALMWKHGQISSTFLLRGALSLLHVLSVQGCHTHWPDRNEQSQPETLTPPRAAIVRPGQWQRWPHFLGILLTS